MDIICDICNTKVPKRCEQSHYDGKQHKHKKMILDANKSNGKIWLTNPDNLRLYKKSVYYCDLCNAYVSINGKMSHLKGLKHLRNKKYFKPRMVYDVDFIPEEVMIPQSEETRKRKMDEDETKIEEDIDFTRIIVDLRNFNVGNKKRRVDITDDEMITLLKGL